MRCCVRHPVVLPTRRTTEIGGTWDFKWPLGTEVRVAFQKPPHLDDKSDFGKARLAVIRLARRWEDEIFQLVSRNTHGITAAEFLRDGIRLSFPDELIFDAPDPTTPIEGDEHRSPFLDQDERRLQYDVLVSFENLPLIRRRSLRHRGRDDESLLTDEHSGEEQLTTATSELGSYARRFDFGLPTIYLGRSGDGLKWPLHEYYTCPIIQHIVVHEFGHVLGLTHEHQNPHFARTPFREAPEIRDTLSRIFRVEREHISLRDVREQVTDAWPGALAFSDWDDLQESNRSLYAIDSLMAYPFHHLYLRPELRPDKPVGPRELQVEIDRIIKLVQRLSIPPNKSGTVYGDYSKQGLLTRPTAVDVANLVRMYAPDAEDRRRRNEATQQ